MKPASTSSVRRAQPHLGTFVDVTAAGPCGASLHRAVEAAFQAVAEVHRLMSFHDPDSDVSRLNRDAAFGPVAVHPWTFEVLRTAQELHRESGGVFDVGVAPALQRLGLLPRAGLEPARSGAAGFAAVELLPDCRVRFRDPRVSIDLGGIAKGFAVDRAVHVLREHGVPRAVVNAGGDLFALGREPCRVHLRDPRNAGRLFGVVDVANQALASSGRLIDRDSAPVSAIIDPRRDAPATANAGATVRAASCMLADALTKLVVILGQAALLILRRHRASALLVSAASASWITGDWRR